MGQGVPADPSAYRGTTSEELLVHSLSVMLNFVKSDEGHAPDFIIPKKLNTPLRIFHSVTDDVIEGLAGRGNRRVILFINSAKVSKPPSDAS